MDNKHSECQLSKVLQKIFSWLFLCHHQHLDRCPGKICSKLHHHLAFPLSPKTQKSMCHASTEYMILQNFVQNTHKHEDNKKSTRLPPSLLELQAYPNLLFLVLMRDRQVFETQFLHHSSIETSLSMWEVTNVFREQNSMHFIVAHHPQRV